MTLRQLEKGIKEAFLVVKEEILTLKNNLQNQKEKNNQFEKKIDVLDTNLNILKDDLKELNSNQKDIEELKSIKDEIKSLRKEIDKLKGRETKIEEKEVVNDTEKKERDYLQYLFWGLAVVLVIFVSFGLYYDWYGLFNETPQENFFRTLEVNEGDLVKLDVIASDKDGDNLFTSFTGPLNSQGEWQTSIGDKGEYSVTVTLSDGQETTSENIKIIVN